MTVDLEGAHQEATGEGVAAWPEIGVSVRCGRLIPQWTACSDHPEAGVIRGRGISRAGAVRSLVRDLRRARDLAPPLPPEARAQCPATDELAGGGPATPTTRFPTHNAIPGEVRHDDHLTT